MNYTNSHLGIEFPLQGLEIFKEEDGWIVLKHPNEESFLSVQFCNHFFGAQDEVEAYIQKEIQLVADANDLHQVVGVNRKDDNLVTAIYSQYISDITHLVYIGVKLLPERNGYWYMAVTKDNAMTDFCEPIFLNTKTIVRTEFGPEDKTTENKLSGHTLKYCESYHSNTIGGGGSSTEKKFELLPDHSFRYGYSSVVSFGSTGYESKTSHNEGWGFWEVQKNNEGNVLIFRWHLKAVSVYQLLWHEPGIIFLGDEKYLLT